MGNHNNKNSYIIWTIVLVAILALTLSFHYIPSRMMMFPKSNLTFSYTIISEEDINSIIERYNNASLFQRIAMNNEPIIRKLMEKGILLENNAESSFNETNEHAKNTNKSDEEVNTQRQNQVDNTLKTVKIGNQTWMAENLNTSNYANGVAIPEAKTAEQWQKYGKEKKGCWCYYENKSANGSKYGKLYNWYAAKKVCPSGWHLPSDAEWTTLTDILGGKDIADKKMKSTSGWNDYDGKSANGTNTSGFTALPGGYRRSDGSFSDVGDHGYWWSSTVNDAPSAWGRCMYYYYSYVLRNNYYKEDGFSVRCVRD